MNTTTQSIYMEKQVTKTTCFSGSKAVIETLLREGVDTVFGYPGGTIMPVYDALYDYRDRLNHILVRHEQGALHAAQGYARVSGRPGVCIVTSGPGATNTVTGLADAMMDSTPVVLISGQVGSGFLGTDAFQETNFVGITQAVTKWNCQVRLAADIPAAIAKAFYIARTGRPGPVVVDITKDAQQEMAEYHYEKVSFIRSYCPSPAIDKEKIAEAGFECDYAEGMHPRILERLVETNMEQTAGYGEDSHCERAAALIKQACGREDIDVHFLVGGTQTNLTVIGSILRPYQGVFCADTGHLNVHETGAIEATGHKVIVLPTTADGRLTAAEIRKAYEAHWNDATHEHMVQPGMVYISQSTEDGTAYTKAELEEISAICRKCELPLFIDGARLGYALAAEDCDHTLQDIARLADVFYIGGTKVGAMMGEAVVIVNPALKKDFRYIIKNRGAMLAKGRLLGIQFETLFEDGLYFQVAKHADKMAMQIRNAFEEKGIKMLFDSKTNQQFPILPNKMMEKLAEKYAFSFWCKVGDAHTAVRFCTSWATKEENVAELLEDIKKL